MQHAPIDALFKYEQEAEVVKERKQKCGNVNTTS